MSLPIAEELQDRWEAGYALGYADGVSMRRDMERIAAFGAIRRAVEEARWYDRRAEASFNEITKVGYNPYATTAMAIRLAIRAAIGREHKHECRL